MGILSDFFLANKDAYRDYNGLDEYPQEDFFRARRLTSLELEGIYAALLGKEDRSGLMGEFNLLTEQDAEQWTYSIPPQMTLALVELPDSEINKIAEKVSEITQEELGWPASDFVPILENLKRLSVRGNEQGKQLFFWMSL